MIKQKLTFFKDLMFLWSSSKTIINFYSLFGLIITNYGTANFLDMENKVSTNIGLWEFQIFQTWHLIVSLWPWLQTLYTSWVNQALPTICRHIHQCHHHPFLHFSLAEKSSRIRAQAADNCRAHNGWQVVSCHFVDFTVEKRTIRVFSI